MYIDNNSLNNIKGYCRTLLASEGKLTRELFDKINKGDDAVIREVLENQMKKIIDSADQIKNEENKKLTLTQTDSIQEVLDALPEILNA